MYIFRRLGRLSKESVQVRGSVNCFASSFLFIRGGFMPTPSPKLVNHSLSSVHGCLFNIFASTLRCWRPSLYSQPEDAPCCGNKGISLKFHSFALPSHTKKQKQTPWPLVRQQNIPTERPPLVDEIYCQLLWIEGCRVVSAADPLGPHSS
jgi:hypothetical protein